MKRIMFSFGLAALAGACFAAEAPPSATELGCTSCHALDHKIVGPSWMDVARRYADKGNDPKFFEQLVKNVSNGEIVRYIFTLSSPPEAKNKK